MLANPEAELRGMCLHNSKLSRPPLQIQVASIDSFGHIVQLDLLSPPGQNMVLAVSGSGNEVETLYKLLQVSY